MLIIEMVDVRNTSKDLNSVSGGNLRAEMVRPPRESERSVGAAESNVLRRVLAQRDEKRASSQIN